MSGKEKCKALKEIRRKIAEENDIEFVVTTCTYQGNCKGTCPKCEEELRYLEMELAKRQKIGKAIIIAGVSLGVIGGLAATFKEPLSELLEDSVMDGFIDTTEF